MALFDLLGVLGASPIPGYFSCLVVVGILAFFARRLFFHPLAKFPGPWINAISGLPVVIPIIRGRQHAYYIKLHRKYGPVVRVSPNELIFCGADAWDDIYGNKPGKPDMEKSPLQAGGLPLNIPARAMTLAPRDDHIRQRKAWAHPFSNTALLGQEPLVRMYIDKLISRLSKMSEEDKVVNIAAWITYCTFDIIGELCFAEPFGCLERGQATEWAQGIANIANAGMYEQATRRVAGVGTWVQGWLARWCIPGEFTFWRREHFARSREKTMKRIVEGGGGEHRGFVYYVLGDGEGEGEGKRGVSDLETVMNLALFVAAGSDTTAIFLTAWTNLMLRNWEVYRKLVDEIHVAFKDEGDIRFPTVRELKYLGAVINETFRMCPPVPTNLCRVVGEGGAVIDGRWVAGGTTVSVSPWAATHLEMNWERPMEFVPERWLDGERGEFGGDKRYASQPFSYGPRGCIGKNLATIEMRLIICCLLLRFDIEAPVRGSVEGGMNERWRVERDMEGMRAWLVWDKPGLWVRLREARKG